jgi:hypothetical protein
MARWYTSWSLGKYRPVLVQSSKKHLATPDCISEKKNVGIVAQFLLENIRKKWQLFQNSLRHVSSSPR